MSSAVSDFDTRPILTVFAGPNGSGKTTLTKALWGEYSANTLVNADEMAATLALAFGLGQATPEMQMKAAIEAENVRLTMLRNRQSFSTETVMSDRERWLRFFTEARELGFRIALVFITTCNPEINVKRVGQRVSKGGHDVDPNKIVVRYHKTHAFLPEVLSLVDEAMLFDNSSPEEPVLVLSKVAHHELQPHVALEQLPAWARALL